MNVRKCSQRYFAKFPRNQLIYKSTVSRSVKRDHCNIFSVQSVCNQYFSNLHQFPQCVWSFSTCHAKNRVWFFFRENDTLQLFNFARHHNAIRILTFFVKLTRQWSFNTFFPEITFNSKPLFKRSKFLWVMTSEIEFKNFPWNHLPSIFSRKIICLTENVDFSVKFVILFYSSISTLWVE